MSTEPHNTYSVFLKDLDSDDLMKAHSESDELLVLDKKMDNYDVIQTDTTFTDTNLRMAKMTVITIISFFSINNNNNSDK